MKSIPLQAIADEALGRARHSRDRRAAYPVKGAGMSANPSHSGGITEDLQHVLANIGAARRNGIRRQPTHRCSRVTRRRFATKRQTQQAQRGGHAA